MGCLIPKSTVGMFCHSLVSFTFFFQASPTFPLSNLQIDMTGAAAELLNCKML